MSPLRTLFPVLLAVLLLAPGCARDDRSTLDRVLEKGTLVVGLEPEFPPFESVDSAGNYVGFDVDMIRALASDLGVELRIEAMAFDSLPAALDAGKIDLIVSGMTKTAERAEKVSFTDSYYDTRLCLLVGKDSGIEHPGDADGKRIVVKLGTTGDIDAPKEFPHSPITKLETEGACANEVATGRADAFLYDELSVVRHHEANPDTTRAVLETVSIQPYAMAARHGDVKFVARLNEFLKAFHADGRYEKARQAHFEEPPR